MQLESRQKKRDRVSGHILHPTIFSNMSCKVLRFKEICQICFCHMKWDFSRSLYLRISSLLHDKTLCGYTYSICQKCPFCKGIVTASSNQEHLFKLIPKSKFINEKFENEKTCTKITFFFVSHLWLLTVSKAIDDKIRNSPWF